MSIVTPPDLGRLNEAQLEILKVFSMNLTEDQMHLFQKALKDFYFKLTTEEAARIDKEKGRTPDDFERIVHDHPKRTTYK